MITVEDIGRQYSTASPYKVSQAKIDEFAKALGERNSAYSGDDAIAPPTFAVLVATKAWMLLFHDKQLGLSLNRCVHVDQKFDFIQPLKDGDAVSSVLTIEQVRHRGNMDFITLRVDLFVDDSVVCIATSTLLHTRLEENHV